MKKAVFLIRTYLPIGIGGPVPSLELLYVASQINKHFPEKYHVKMIDLGIGSRPLKDIQLEIASGRPCLVCLHAFAWEADLVHKIAALAKAEGRADIQVVVFGQLAMVAGRYLCEDPNIDYVLLGEPEWAIADLLKVLDGGYAPSKVPGLSYKRDNGQIVMQDPVYPEDIDSLAITSFAWDLIDIKAYAQYLNWNGAIKEEFYIPILTSRGCPYSCSFCCETYDKHFRARSPENVMAEIYFLKEKFDVKEIHVFDAVFNHDIERAKAICRLLIQSGVAVSLAFPHGIRADRMTDELLHLLRQAGTYKLVYGIETAVPRLQKHIRKNLDLDAAQTVIRKTAETGIITGGYFMLGFPTETQEEMEITIDFAVKSDLDVAAFFKMTDYNDINTIYASRLKHNASPDAEAFDFKDVSYFSVKGSQSDIPAAALNQTILRAQKKFYLNWRRFWRGLRRYPRKSVYLRNFINALGLIVQAQLEESLGRGEGARHSAESLRQNDHV